ncbi:NADP-dependent aldehyde dehydrogenase [Plantibacter sp. VKM Ac-1784]|uniref:NADP-dependent aldehyde dehydrogenase n=1 Tax=Plantibacter elymi (nom. nud.) TaxID=199708 RepID=A0ABY1RGJ6_9MICO|nr:aldehyde dehydrogenase (NADP(+)) [Plantibacter sp. VKM Ac-1784]SMQ73543.1 NADP-dependent aldehyde dehydrogenase [Plantibacter sp. VKM Ac-1784]
MHDTDHSTDTIDRTEADLQGTTARTAGPDGDSDSGRTGSSAASAAGTAGIASDADRAAVRTVDEVASAAAAAASDLASTVPSTRAAWLEAVADALDARVDELVALADEESHLGTARLTGEVARTTGQLRLFAAVLRDGAFLEVVIDHADASATPPKPELRRMLRPTGPVAVFSASNFPFAFSVAGGDTASALAAGCPVIVKAHSAHPRLSRLTAAIVVEALRSAGAPDGTFALVEGREQGTALVRHPAITAVGFTGSLAGGRALFDLASQRPAPIPFYGELGSTNPVVITETALQGEAAGELARGLAASFTLGVGQFCTNPGLVLVPSGSGFAELVAQAAADTVAGRMLTPGIAQAYAAGTTRAAGHPGVRTLLGGETAAADSGVPTVLATTAATVLDAPDVLLEEIFGPATLVIEVADDAELHAVLAEVGGALTATVHAAPGEDVTALVARLESIAGRVLFGGWPTGVAVGWAQHHGGPWPATTSLHTSVGASAVRRFQRPIVYQDAPERVLPEALHEANPLRLPRRVDGVLELPTAARA